MKFYDILNMFDQNKAAIATFMDLSKALDCVDILLSILKWYGILATALQWINSYLSNQEHLFSWNQTSSPSISLNISMPQGSILRYLVSHLH